MALNLTKGNRINLTKNVNDSKSEKLSIVCFGSNWGAITKKSIFGNSSESVDLDSSVLVYDKNKNLIDTVYFGHTSSKDKSIRHSGDDTTGDVNGDDGLDNEVITVDLSKINSSAEYIVFILNSYRHQKFDEIPFSSLRIYLGTPGRVDEVLATYKLDNNPEFVGKEAIVLGHLYRKDNWWKFKADGECTNERNIESISKGSALKVL